jgi:hypothetical protein
VELLKSLCEAEIGFQILGFDRHRNHETLLLRKRSYCRKVTIARRPLLPEGGY